MKKFKEVSSKVNFVELEKENLKFWKENQIFEKTLKGGKKFSFYDGPPFATGLPHYGHLLAGILKDVVPRYQTMNGYDVERRFGWDCHGLPVEAEVQKKLGLFSKKDVQSFGVGRFNEECRSVVLKYTDEWKKTVEKVGRFVDMDKPYHTMDVDFMQSVWWVFKELYNKNLVYESYKVVPYSVGLGSVLSNFEANQNYRDVQDMSLTVNFSLNEKPWTLLAWTTTPWTLPMNTALAVNKDLTYCVVSFKSQLFVVSKNQVDSFFKSEFEVVEDVLGKDLLNLTYSPLFNFYSNKFKVVHSDHVNDQSGTGVVHLAPAYGEEDFEVGKKEKLPLFNPIDDDGVFSKDVGFLSGKNALDSNDEVFNYLKENKKVFKKDTYSHSYPYCYRTNTKLMYKAVTSWFVKVTDLKDKMMKNNQETSWNPDHLKNNRFGNWLSQSRDWAVSRNRFWGTPLPLWKNEEGEVYCVGSKKELEDLAGVQLEDLHSHHVGHLEIPSPTGKSALKWVGGVLDCWFESGSMPYAQFGYPYKEGSVQKLNEQFPANFVAEGLDQTRGWFYTLNVLGTALFDKSPFKQVLVNGLVLAEDGKKMSKMLKNYPDPNVVLDTYGADALRLYLLNSPVVCAEELKFSVTGVNDQVKKNLLRLHNVYSFFSNYANVDNYSPSENLTDSENLLDLWLLSRLTNLVKNVRFEMDNYNLQNVVPKLESFIEDLTNTYVRFNRQLFWEPGMNQKKQMAYNTLYYCLLEFSKVLAPFVPFYSEYLYKNLNDKELSVHLESFPLFDDKFNNQNLEESVSVMMDLVELGRNYREQVKVKNKIPLLSMTVVHKNEEVLKTLKNLELFFKEELNVREVSYNNEENKYVNWTVKPNFKELKGSFGDKLKDIQEELKDLSSEAVFEFYSKNLWKLKTATLSNDQIVVARNKKTDKKEVCFNQAMVCIFDPTIKRDQVLEGDFREVLRKLQESRKMLNLKLNDFVSVELFLKNDLYEYFKLHENVLLKEVLVKDLKYVQNPQGDFNGEIVELEVKYSMKK